MIKPVAVVILSMLAGPSLACLHDDTTVAIRYFTCDGAPTKVEFANTKLVLSSDVYKEQELSVKLHFSDSLGNVGRVEYVDGQHMLFNRLRKELAEHVYGKTQSDCLIASMKVVKINATSGY